MNINNYKKYRFTKIVLKAIKSGNEYNVRVNENDRLYIYLKPYIIQGGVEGLTSIIIDELYIENGIDTFRQEGIFNMSATLLAIDRENYVHAFPIVIEKLQLKINPLKVLHNGECLKISLCEMELPYKTEIKIGEEFVDVED